MEIVVYKLFNKMKRTFLTLVFVCCISIGNAIAQIYSGASAVVSIRIDNTNPILTIRGVRNYNIYNLTVDSVLMLNVCEEFQNDFNTQYLLSCKYLEVCLDSSQYYQSKTDWYPERNYIIEVGVGYGIGDLPFKSVVENGLYLADPFSIRMCSWCLLPESLPKAYLTPLEYNINPR